MPNRVTGSTDTTGAVSVLPGAAKTICVIAGKGTTPGAQVEVLFDIVGTQDAAEAFGAGSKGQELVKVLINNGVSSIKGIIPPDVTGGITTKADAYASVLTKLLPKNVDIIICDETDNTVHAKIKDHLDLAEAEDKFRYSVVGQATGQTNTQLATAATALNHKRVFMPGPTVVDSAGTALSGIYAAAALAALIATETNDPALPMNGVEMLGFGGVERVILKSEIDTLVAGGVTPLFTSAGGRPAVYRLVTTYTKNSEDTADPTWQEGTTMFIADDVLGSVQARLRANYQRTKNVIRILDSIRSDVIDVLQTKNSLEIIENFDPKTVSVRKSPTDAYGALIDYTFDVVTPLYTLTITQHMKI